jgi:ribosome-associated toxin RatA of RatAB toxin-antitoxin module
MLSRLLACLLLACALPAMARTIAPEVVVKRVDAEDQHVFDVSASGTVHAGPAVVWKILTDYEHMPEFVPDLQSAKILARSGNEAIVEQFGVARFLFISRDIHLVVRVTEQAMSAIDISMINGDMKIYHCRWEMSPIAETGGTRISYTGRLVPKFYVPGMLGANIVRSDVQHMMSAVLAHIDGADKPQ